MQMTQCSPAAAHAFLAQVHPCLDLPLTPAGQTLPMLAASISSLPLLHAALPYRPNLSARDSLGRTALHYSAAVGCIQAFELLVGAGCDACAETIGGETPLSKACTFAQGEIIEWYLNNRLEAFERADKLGKKPLEILRNSGELLYEEVRDFYAELRGENAMID